MRVVVGIVFLLFSGISVAGEYHYLCSAESKTKYAEEDCLAKILGRQNEKLSDLNAEILKRTLEYKTLGMDWLEKSLQTTTFSFDAYAENHCALYEDMVVSIGSGRALANLECTIGLTVSRIKAQEELLKELN